MADPYPFDPSGLNQPVGRLPQLTTLDEILNGVLGNDPPPPPPYITPIAPVVQGVPVGQLVAQQTQPVIPPMWLADP